MDYLSKKEKEALAAAGVHGDLRAVVLRALELLEAGGSGVRAYVFHVLRTEAEQAKLVKAGKSKRADSRHLTGHAADLTPRTESGRPSWPDDWKGVWEVAEAMRQAARELRTPLVWGACWCRIDDTSAPLRELVEGYKLRKRRQGKTPFLDGVHFELWEKAYPAPGPAA